MKDDYLWDGSGEPDPEIRRLEAALSGLRHNRPAPVFPQAANAVQPPVRGRWMRMCWWPSVAGVAAGILLIAALQVLLPATHPPTHPPVTQAAGWDLTTVRTTPSGEAQPIDARPGDILGNGRVLETDIRSHARLHSEEVGEINVEPGTKLRLLELGTDRARLALDRGTIHASIWAPAGKFVIDTPSAVAVDLGCTYTLHVDDSGNGLLRTTFGWVGFKLNGREAFIPAGAACATRPRTGPGTPYFEDASVAFRAALAKLDAENISPADRDEALQVVLKQSRPPDALTLWHLLSRVSESQRGTVYDRLAKLVPPPSGVTREGILRLDQTMLDQWWNALNFGDVSLWRHWEREWEQSK